MTLGKIFVAIYTLLILPCATFAQSGCTDPAASNYNPAATINDGSCIYPVTHYSPPLRAALNPIITESSGIVFTDGKMWTHNDSGNPNEIYSVDTTDGHTIQTVTIDNFSNIDWEDITADSGYIYIGDHGNNNGSRTDLRVLKVKKADIGSGASVHVNAEAISFAYTDQTNFTPSSTHNFDCEALISIKDSLYIFTKDRGDLKTRVYKMPKVPGSYNLSPYTNFNVGGLITGADYDSINKQIVLVGYLSGHANSFLWFLNNYQGDMFFSGNKRRIEIGNGQEWQTEGVCFISSGHFFISCETAGNINASLFTGDKTWLGPAAVKTNYVSHIRLSPNPFRDMLQIGNMERPGNYVVTNILGQLIQQGGLNSGVNNIQFDAGKYSGTLIICVTDDNGNKYCEKIIKY